MPIATDKTKALCFDLGNTLIEFGPKQVAYKNDALEELLEELFGFCDSERLKAIRDRQILAPYENGYRENDLAAVCDELIREAYDVEPQPEHVQALVRNRYETFVHIVELPEGVLPLLDKLRQRYQLGLLSNYPCGQSIRDALDKTGLTEMFEAIVVSGEVGYAKPHPTPFETLLGQLGRSPSECVHIGDNWLADIQGAKRLGMGAILTTQYVPYESFEPHEGDHPPDVSIEHLDELEELLLS